MEQTGQNAEAAGQAAGRETTRPGRDRTIKLAFVAVTVVVLGAIYYSQRGLGISGWEGDVPAALTQAAAENRSVVVFFANSPPGENERWIKANIIAKAENETALEKGRFIKVLANVSNKSKSALARRYGITELPTLLLLGPDGAEKNRREGRIGEVEFRTGFLDCSRVNGPAATSKPR